jgi:phage N-6-adenine-methyltransferase
MSGISSPANPRGSVHFSSKTDEWATPQDFFAACNRIWGFTTDVCALPENAKCPAYFTPEQDGLKQDWAGACWMNPPYGREIGRWMRKAWESSAQGATVVCLVPARTCTRWWHDYATRGAITFVRGRLKFGGSNNSAPFPSALVTFGSAKRYIKQCVAPGCDLPFAAERAHAESCSGACRVALHRHRRAA